MSKRAVIYARASLDATKEGRSVDRQTEACRALCAARGWTVLAELQDNSISAYGDKRRPAWDKVLGMIERGETDVVVAWHLDRMMRSMLALEELILLIERHGVGIATATGDIDLTTDVGRMVARILAAVARAEVERKAARQKLSNQQLAAEGKPWSGGARPFGYTSDQLEVVPAEAEAIRWAAQAALDGVSMGAIAQEWTSRGLESSRAKHAKGSWTPRGVKAVLVSPRYAGIRMYRGTDMGQGVWPAILDADTHAALVTKLNDPSRKVGAVSGSKIPRNLLSTIATCEVCSKPLRAASVKRRLTYTCPQSHVNPPRELADVTVEAAMVGLLSQRDFLLALAPAGDDNVDDMRADLDALHRRSKILAQGLADGSVDESTFLEVSRSLRERIKAREIELTAATAGSSLHGLSIGSADVLREWNGLLLERKRIIIGQFLTVTALRKQRMHDRWDPELHLAVGRKQNSPAPA